MKIKEAREIERKITEKLGENYPTLQYIRSVGYKKELQANGRCKVFKMKVSEGTCRNEMCLIGEFERKNIVVGCIMDGFDWESLLNSEDPNRRLCSELGKDYTEKRTYEPSFSTKVVEH